jgi:c-di-AMP phosphodiesterase-like protein
MIDYKTLKQQLELLDKSTVVLIAGHKNADYDSISSCIALAHILTKIGYVSYALLEEKDLDKTFCKINMLFKTLFALLIHNMMTTLWK